MASNSIKRQRKRRRIDTDGDPEFQVAPMVDVLLVLMLFFMAITSTEVLKKDKNLQLADARHAKQNSNHKNEIIVNVGWDGINSVALLSMNGINYSGATDPQLQGALNSQHQQNPAAYVVIRADKNVQYSNVADLISACASAGISTVTFAVLIGGNNNKQAAAPGAAASN